MNTDGEEHPFGIHFSEQPRQALQAHNSMRDTYRALIRYGHSDDRDALQDAHDQV